MGDISIKNIKKQKQTEKFRLFLDLRGECRIFSYSLQLFLGLCGEYPRRIFLGLRGEYTCRIFSYSLVCVVSIPVEYSLVCVVSIPVEYSVVIWSAWLVYL